MLCTMTEQVTFKFHLRYKYYDRGIYDTQNCCWVTGCLSGVPSLHENERKLICCCVPCNPCFNQFMECYSPWLCGERVRVVSCEKFCCICSNRASSCTNFCGLCGYMDGEPLHYPFSFVNSLIDGEAAKLIFSLNTSRSKWIERTNAVR